MTALAHRPPPPLLGGVLSGSTDSRARDWRPPPATPPTAPRREARRREKGIALILALSAIAILAVVLADMHENTGTSYALATTQRDRLKAEYMARSGLNLTRMLIANEEPIRQAVTPFYRMMLRRDPPQLPIWSYANDILQPFCDYEAAQANMGQTGLDFSAAGGMGETDATCRIVAFAENSKLNLNNPLHMGGDPGRINVGMQVFAMTGGYQAPSPYDSLFERRDGDGQITTRLDVISALVDWWDYDTQRTVFDPGAGTVDSNAGAEDDIYSSFREPYSVKNAPFDSLEELRMIRGVGDDFWATFVEPDPEDPASRSVTIYGSGKVHLNEADPRVLLARTCSILVDQPLCTDPNEAAKFIQLLGTARQMAPIPWFARVEDYMQFLQGQGDQGELRPMLEALLGGDNALLPAPVTISRERRDMFGRVFVTGAAIIFVQSTGQVGACDPTDEDAVGRCTSVRIRSVLNFDPPWTPPPPNAGRMPRMGIFHHYRVD
ncbi:MAG TPA: type II secretion system protein GspK [Sandaracinaceae bacterium LLY-WYZ-13_1]|nr:type II secretion system protein GspK [Sandaracinaceae bacterium LLY-WYZ-13_1]